jgi:hypothetical protein
MGPCPVFGTLDDLAFPLREDDGDEREAGDGPVVE